MRSYPDTLQVTWSDWCERLHQPQDPALHSDTAGFQCVVSTRNAQGQYGSDERSRCKELWELGYLLQRIVGEGSRTVPAGWARVCADTTTVSQLGYLAYALGKGLAIRPDLQAVRQASAAVNFLSVLPFGINDPTVAVSVPLLYLYWCQGFATQLGFPGDISSLKPILELITLGFFTTLSNEAATNDLCDFYRTGQVVDNFKIQLKDGILPVSINDLDNHLNNRTKITLRFGDVVRDIDKGRLYWIGADVSRIPLFPYWYQPGLEFINAVMDADRQNLQIHDKSLLHDLLVFDPQGADYKLFEKLHEILAHHAVVQASWRKLMKDVMQGVYEALRQVELSTSTVASPRAFYIRGGDFDPTSEAELIVEVPKYTVPVLPEPGNLVFKGQHQFSLTEITSEGETYRLRLVREVSPVTDPALST